MTVAAPPTLTICIPTLGRTSLVERALPSVLAVSSVPLEVVVAVNRPGVLPDDPSLHDERVRALPDVPGGVSAVRNAAAREARGQVLLFLDDDDAFVPGGVELLAELMADPRVDFASASCRVLDGSGEIRTRRPRALGPLFDHAVGDYLPGMFAVRAAAFRAVGGYNTDITFGENTEMVMRICRRAHAEDRRVLAMDRVVVERWPSSARYVKEAADSALVLLDVHREVFAREPVERARLQQVAGVARFRVGDRSGGRRLLWAGLRSNPRDARAYYRLAISLVPPLATRTWSRGA